MKYPIPIQWALAAYSVYSLALTGCGTTTASDSLEAQQISVINTTAVDWPRFRGANFDGISPESGWQTDWPVEGPPIRWRRNVGTGFSSFAVADGRVFTLGHNSNGQLAPDSSQVDDQRGADTVWCLDATSGDVAWSYSYPCKLVDNLHDGGPAATPILHSGQVYTLSKEGHLIALDAASGSVIWKQQLQPLLNVKMPEWGFSGSPLVIGELLVIDAGVVAAFDRHSGDLVWNTVPFKPGYGSPVRFSRILANGQREDLIAVLNNECLLILRSQDGTEVARRKWTTQYTTTATTPIVVNDAIFISTGYRRGCLLTRLVGDELVDVYENREMCNQMNNSVLWDGHWYGFNGNASRSRTVTLTCMHAASGEVQWTERGLGCGSLMIAGGLLVCLSDDGELAVVNPTPEGYNEVARAEILPGRCWSVPVLSDKHLYARNSAGDVVCVDLRMQ